MKKGKRNATEGIHFFFLMRNIERNSTKRMCFCFESKKEKGMLS